MTLMPIAKRAIKIIIIIETARGMPYSSALCYANLPFIQQLLEQQAPDFLILRPDSCLHC